MQAGDLALGGVATRRVSYHGKGGAGGTGEFLGSAFGGVLRGSEEGTLLACAFGGWGVVTSGCVARCFGYGVLENTKKQSFRMEPCL